MKNFLAVILGIVVQLFFFDALNAAMTEKQLAAAVKLVKNTCQPKTKTTQEDIDKMHIGDFDVDHTAMCYLQCGMTMNRLMNADNTFNYDYGVNLAKKTLPEARRAPTLASIEECKDAAVSFDDKCKAAWEYARCMYMSNPENYFFP